jgi:chitooligosaccharide deacetylase
MISRSRLPPRLDALARRARSLTPGARWLVYRREGLRGRRLLAITFDDGPSGWTPAILELLASHGAPATFFILGEAVDAHEEILRRMVADGHELGNHTYSHPDPAEASDEELRDEIMRANARIAEASGRAPIVMRPPYGGAPKRVARVTRRLGIRTVMRSVDPKDWSKTSGREIADDVLAAVEPGDIVDLHDGIPPGSQSHPSRQPTVDAVARLVPALHDRGYELVTVSGLLAADTRAR